jgi:nucleolar protein 9
MDRAGVSTRSFAATAMPKELRKRGRRHKTSRTEHKTPAQGQGVLDEGSSAGPSWIVPRADSKQLNPEAPFGYVDPELKAYFRTVDDQLKEWQQSRDHAEGEEDVERECVISCPCVGACGVAAVDAATAVVLVSSTFGRALDRRMFLMAALQEISGKERELATDPDCAGGLERMAYSMDDFVRRVFMDSLTGS